MNLENKGTLKHILIEMGLSKEMVSHKAFNVLLNELYSQLTREHGISKIKINKDTCHITREGNIIRIKSSSGDLLDATLIVEPDNISLNISEHPNDGLQNQQINRQYTIIGKLLPYPSKLEISEIEGSAIFSPEKKNQHEGAIVTKRLFSSSGIETDREFHRDEFTRDTNMLVELSISNYNDLATRSMYGNRGTHVNFQRVGIDYVYVAQTINGEKKYGHKILSNEAGLQEMRIVTPTQGKYYDDEIVPLTEKQYEDKIQHRNSMEIQEALREYTKSERVSGETKKR